MTIGSDPSLFWRPWCGSEFHLRPSDMADLTLQQYAEMWDVLKERRRRRG